MNDHIPCQSIPSQSVPSLPLRYPSLSHPLPKLYILALLAPYTPLPWFASLNQRIAVFLASLRLAHCIIPKSYLYYST